MNSDRSTRARAVAEKARMPLLPVVPVMEHEHADGKWYSMWGVPHSAGKSTGNNRIKHYAMMAKNGTTIGTAGKTEQEVIDRQKAYRQATVDDFYAKLMDMSEKDFKQQEEYWLKQP